MAAQSNFPASKPTHRIFNVTGTGKGSTWTELGAAWPNQDDNGFSIQCNAMPLQGRIVMRKITPRAKNEAA